MQNEKINPASQTESNEKGDSLPRVREAHVEGRKISALERKKIAVPESVRLKRKIPLQKVKTAEQGGQSSAGNSVPSSNSGSTVSPVVRTGPPLSPETPPQSVARGEVEKNSPAQGKQADFRPVQQSSPEKSPVDSRKTVQESDGMFMRIIPRPHDLKTDIKTTLNQEAPKGGHYIIWATLVFFIVFLIWAYFSQIEQVVRAEGKVVPSSQIQIVQNLEGGIVSEIDTKVGDVVEAGQLLLKIDKTRFDASYKESRGGILALTAKVARLEAEAHEKKFEIPKVVQDENPEIGKREEELYLSRVKARDNAQQILKEKLSQKKQELAEMEARLNELNRSSKLLQQELRMTEPLVKQGAVSQVEVLRLRRQSSDMNGDIESARLTIPKLRSQVSEAQKAIVDGRLEYINRAREELNKAYVELQSNSASSVALIDRLDRTQVRSPVKGTVNRILVNTVGGIIQPGMDLIEIVPLEDTLLIEAKIKPQDIAFLRPDMKAKVKFSAYDFTIYGGLDAKLEQISADSLTDKAGNDYYLVRLRTEKNYLGTEKHPLPIIPGMIVTVDIISGKKRILTYLLKPILRAQKFALREM